jgi:hypothetical protein
VQTYRAAAVDGETVEAERLAWHRQLGRKLCTERIHKSHRNAFAQCIERSRFFGDE